MIILNILLTNNDGGLEYVHDATAAFVASIIGRPAGRSTTTTASYAPWSSTEFNTSNPKIIYFVYYYTNNMYKCFPIKMIIRQSTNDTVHRSNKLGSDMY